MGEYVFEDLQPSNQLDILVENPFLYSNDSYSKLH